MQFLVYIVVLAVSFSTILMELHWLTSPATPPKAVVASTTTPPKSKVEGPNTELSPVYPKAEAKADAPRVIEGVTAAPAVAADAKLAKTPEEAAKPAQTAKTEPVTPAPVAPAAPADVAKTEAKAEAVTEPAQTNTVQTKVETSGAATPADSRATFTSTVPTPQAAKFTPPAQTATVAAGKCDVAACASAYSSFRASDCTYQPFEGARQVCKSPVAGQKTAAAPRATPTAEVHKRGRDEELRDVEREVRRMTPRTADVDDDVIYIRRPRW